MASVISAIAGLWYLPAIDNVTFSMIGAVKNQFEVSVWILIVFAVMFTAVAFGISVLLSAPIKKITAYSLLKDQRRSHMNFSEKLKEIRKKEGIS